VRQARLRRPTLARRPGAAALGLLALLGARPATGANEPAASGPRVDVAVLRPAADDGVLVAAAARVRLELGASGFTSTLVETAGDAPQARLAFVREDGVATIDLLASLADGTPHHRRLGVPRAAGGDDAAVLALRAVELLRGMRLAARRPPAARPVAAPELIVDQEAPAAPGDSLGPLRLFAGLAALEGRLVGAGAGLSPGVALGLSAAVAPHVALVLSGAGPFFRDLEPTLAGSAHTHEELGLVGLRIEAHLRAADVRLLVATGAHHLQAAFDERGRAPGTGSGGLHLRGAPSLWSPFIAAGVGVSRALRGRVGVSAELDAVVLQPSIEVAVDGHVVGGAGGPSLLEVVDVWVAFP
jgi:hypothetical protein